MRHARSARDLPRTPVCPSHLFPLFAFTLPPNRARWYGAPGDISNAASTWKANADWAAANFPTKPFTVSETGGGGIYEWVNASSPGAGQFWSQKYQTSIVTADVKYLLGDARVTGLSLWLLTDFKVDFDANSCGQCTCA